MSKLVGYLEGLLSEGAFGPQIEENIRVRVAETLSAFGMQHHEADLERKLILIREAMGA